MSGAKEQYTAGFEEWWASEYRGNWSKEVGQVVWSAASLRMEVHKDKSIGAKLSRLQAKWDTQVAKYETAAQTRMQIHRDDYERAALLIAGLKQIEKIGGRAGKVAVETLDECLVSLRKLRSRIKKEQS